MIEIMPKHQKDLLQTILRGYDPFGGFPRSLYGQDMQGWGSQHAYLAEAIRQRTPKTVVEVGVWKGGSTIFMASILKELQLDAAVIAVDTWLGAWDHYIDETWLPSLGFEFGQPTLMRKFMSNVLAAGVDNLVIPVALDSLNAAEMLRIREISADVIHIDGGHDYKAVRADLDAWWPLLRPGGLLIGDDYYHDGSWPGVRQAFDEFLLAKALPPCEFAAGKCKIAKPSA